MPPHEPIYLGPNWPPRSRSCSIGTKQTICKKQVLTRVVLLPGLLHLGRTSPSLIGILCKPSNLLHALTRDVVPSGGAPWSPLYRRSSQWRARPVVAEPKRSARSATFFFVGPTGPARGHEPSRNIPRAVGWTQSDVDSRVIISHMNCRTHPK